MAGEARFWEWLRDGLRGVPALDMNRVENYVGPGMPDVELCYQGVQAWVELKSEDRPARPTSKIRYKTRKAQGIWLRRRAQCGGSAWLYCRVGTGSGARRYLIPGIHYQKVDDGCTEAELAALSVLHPEHDAMEMLEAVTAGRQRYLPGGLAA